ncbi:ParB/RepB/Spo0J family partition protein [Thermodesulfobacteriota bacterium]
MSYRLTVLDLTVIDLDDDTYRITTSAAVEDLAISVKHVGLINPPILIQKQDRYSIVAGFRRIAAMHKLNYRQISAKVMPPESLPLECIRIAIADNTSQRKLDILEISRALVLLDAYVEDRECLFKEAKNLGLPDNHQHIGKIMGIRRLPHLIQEGIYQNRISLNMAAELQEFDASTGILLARLFMELKLNRNKQREICSHLKEIAHREKRGTQEILLSEGLSEVLADKDLDNLQKTRVVRSNLRRRRFPNLSLAEESFQHNLRKLNLGSGIRLLPPEYFEGTFLKLSMSFKNETELKEQIDILNKTLTNPHLSKLFQTR